jgi:hypothetical protein
MEALQVTFDDFSSSLDFHLFQALQSGLIVRFAQFEVVQYKLESLRALPSFRDLFKRLSSLSFHDFL